MDNKIQIIDDYENLTNTTIQYVESIGQSVLNFVLQSAEGLGSECNDLIFKPIK